MGHVLPILFPKLNLKRQTKRNLKTRLEEHDPITFGKSDVTDHLRENPDHTIDFHNPLILAQETNWRKLRIKEKLYIQKLQPQLNSDEASHPLYQSYSTNFNKGPVG